MPAQRKNNRQLRKSPKKSSPAPKSSWSEDPVKKEEVGAFEGGYFVMPNYTSKSVSSPMVNSGFQRRRGNSDFARNSRAQSKSGLSSARNSPQPPKNHDVAHQSSRATKGANRGDEEKSGKVRLPSVTATATIPTPPSSAFETSFSADAAATSSIFAPFRESFSSQLLGPEYFEEPNHYASLPNLQPSKAFTSPGISPVFLHPNRSASFTEQPKHSHWAGGAYSNAPAAERLPVPLFESVWCWCCAV